MNQTALKTFAQDARRKLRHLIGARLDYVLTADTAELRQQVAQLNELRSALKSEGRDPLIERVAYTWFNRLAALRFMDANGYHPFGAHVITPATANETLPELLQRARAGALDPDLASIPTAHRSLTTGQLITDLLAGRIPVDHPEAQVFKLLLVASCNYYHRFMPFLFEKIGDATELLLPEDLLTEHSIVADFRENLTDEDCRNEETLGWFYQFYISEKKAEVDARKTAVAKEDIPAKTQLFTPHWIVRYLVENTLGRLWLLNRPHSRLRAKMPYYIEGDAETDFLKITKPEEVRLLDPAGGSGHMLTYAFDLLYAIYEEEGYDAPDIPGLILKHNLYGVDICDRAVALAAFALCMKARAKDNRFFRRMLAGGGPPLQPHLLSLQEIRFAEGELSAYFNALGTQPSALNPQLTKLLYQFEEAKNYGSLIQPCLSESEISNLRSQILERISTKQQLDLAVSDTHAKVLCVLEQAEYLSQRYHVVVANPPYMGGKQMNLGVKEFASERFPNSRSDLFAMFIERSFNLVFPFGFTGMVTMHAWMFLSSFENMRKDIIATKHILTMAHLGARAFDSIGGEVVQTTAFVCNSARGNRRKGLYIRLTDGRCEAEKESLLVSAIAQCQPDRVFQVSADDFAEIDGSPVAYWLSPRVRQAFKNGKALGKLCAPRKGNTTTNNARFLRVWFEVERSKVGLDYKSAPAANSDGKKWLPYNKGGTFRKWYGANEFLVNWADNGREIKEIPHSVVANEKYFFSPGLTWTTVASARFSVRKFGHGFIFDNGGCCIFLSQELSDYVNALLNSAVFHEVFAKLNPTLNFQSGEVAKFPVIFPKDTATREGIESNACEAVSLARADWDNFETSWDFRDMPFLRPGLKRVTLEASWQNWKAHCDAAIHRMQELETENNRLFIAAYGLQEELAPEVPEDQITLARADARKDMAAFLSYAIGCMMGRYSLDKPSLILADAGATTQQCLAQVPHPTFVLDSDGILPVLDGEWFKDDIVAQFRQFLRVTFGEDQFTENLNFIETTLGRDIRNYFVKDFYKNHISQERAFGYKKRPIYWMFSSPEGNFQALVYLHRYTKDTLNLLLNEYVRKFIEKLEERQRHLNGVRLNEASRPGDVTKAMKELVKIEKMLKELRDWERNVLLPLAQQRIELDLDDGVKVNYQKFKGVVVPIPGLEKQEEE